MPRCVSVCVFVCLSVCVFMRVRLCVCVRRVCVCHIRSDRVHACVRQVLFKARMLGEDSSLIEFWERSVLVRERSDLHQ